MNKVIGWPGLNEGKPRSCKACQGFEDSAPATPFFILIDALRTRTGGNRENRAGFLSPFSLFPPVEFKMKRRLFLRSIAQITLSDQQTSALRSPRTDENRTRSTPTWMTIPGGRRRRNSRSGKGRNAICLLVSVCRRRR